MFSCWWETRLYTKSSSPFSSGPRVLFPTNIQQRDIKWMVSFASHFHGPLIFYLDLNALVCGWKPGPYLLSTCQGVACSGRAVLTMKREVIISNCLCTLLVKITCRHLCLSGGGCQSTKCLFCDYSGWVAAIACSGAHVLVKCNGAQMKNGRWSTSQTPICDMINYPNIQYFSLLEASDVWCQCFAARPFNRR